MGEVGKNGEVREDGSMGEVSYFKNLSYPSPSERLGEVRRGWQHIEEY
jgi:hypothetical protein